MAIESKSLSIKGKFKKSLELLQEVYEEINSGCIEHCEECPYRVDWESRGCVEYFIRGNLQQGGRILERLLINDDFRRMSDFV